MKSLRSIGGQLLLSAALLVAAIQGAQADIVSAYGKYVDDKGNIALPENFLLEWVHMGSWAVLEGEKASGLHNVYAPRDVVEYYQKNHEFPDGAMMIKEVRGARGSTHTTGEAFWAQDVAVWFIMVKDTQNRFPDNALWGEGWGWAMYEGKDRTKQVASDYKSDCLGCHVPVQDADWTYVYGYPVLGDEVSKFAPKAEVTPAKAEEKAMADSGIDEAVLKQGEKVFRRCKACHSLEAGKHRTGPSLAGLFGRKAGGAEGYKYSQAMLDSDVVWNAETLDAHLLDVPNFIPGNKMGKVFPAGVKKAEDRKAVIEFLKTQ
ncbi:cytochrome P460 family protein [Roseibium sediminis]|uniref:cytochrome P460 family protein n=1 Tax=Roseibium sediminis TaxID=1775174 RepID=UPI00123D1559|nr:cytochrome P460 family protein [Roseibium sediminis]